MVRSHRIHRLTAAAAASLALAACASAPAPVSAQAGAPAPVQRFVPEPTYVDLIELVRASPIVARVTIDEQILVPPERAPGLPPGQVRLYLESLTQALLGGNVPVGGLINFLADVPALPDGKAPKIEELSYIIFARPVSGRPGEVQLVGTNAMHPATPELEARLRTVLQQLAENALPPRITDVREVISVDGNLAGESETQIFLETENGAPVSLNVLRRPGQTPRWGVSWTEIVDQAARPPQPGTLQWYGLACFLPERLPAGAFLQDDRAAQVRASEDYRLILDQLGPCARNA